MASIESGQRARQWTWLAALVAAVLLAATPIASADEIVKLKAELAGTNEVPPSGSPGYWARRHYLRQDDSYPHLDDHLQWPGEPGHHGPFPRPGIAQRSHGPDPDLDCFGHGGAKPAGTTGRHCALSRGGPAGRPLVRQNSHYGAPSRCASRASDGRAVAHYVRPLPRCILANLEGRRTLAKCGCR